MNNKPPSNYNSYLVEALVRVVDGIPFNPVSRRENFISLLATGATQEEDGKSFLGFVRGILVAYIRDPVLVTEILRDFPIVDAKRDREAAVAEIHRRQLASVVSQQRHQNDYFSSSSSGSSSIHGLAHLPGSSSGSSRGEQEPNNAAVPDGIANLNLNFVPQGESGDSSEQVQMVEGIHNQGSFDLSVDSNCPVVPDDSDEAGVARAAGVFRIADESQDVASQQHHESNQPRQILNLKHSDETDVGEAGEAAQRNKKQKKTIGSETTAQQHDYESDEQHQNLNLCLKRSHQSDDEEDGVGGPSNKKKRTSF